MGVVRRPKARAERAEPPRAIWRGTWAEACESGEMAARLPVDRRENASVSGSTVGETAGVRASGRATSAPGVKGEARPPSPRPPRKDASPDARSSRQEIFPFFADCVQRRVRIQGS